MLTRMSNPAIVLIKLECPDRVAVERAASVLSSGGLVVAPTETRYGLLARADHSQVMDRLFEVKRRPQSMPTAIFVDSLEKIWQFAKHCEVAESLARKFLPGPLTLVLEAAVDLGEPVVNDGRIGLRWSNAPFIIELIKNLNFPVTATSANLSGSNDTNSIEQIHAVFGEAVGLYIDCGPLTGPPSTVVDCSDKTAYIVREGAISAEEVLAISRLIMNE